MRVRSTIFSFSSLLNVNFFISLPRQVAQDKVAKAKTTTLPTTTDNNNKQSPFTSRRSETMPDVLAGRRRSFFTTPSVDSQSQQPQQQQQQSETGSAAAVSPDGEGLLDGDVSKRSSRALGLSGDVLKEMKVRQQEKRASVIPRTGGGEFPAAAERAPTEEENNPFGNVKLR